MAFSPFSGGGFSAVFFGAFGDFCGRTAVIRFVGEIVGSGLVTGRRLGRVPSLGQKSNGTAKRRGGAVARTARVAMVSRRPHASGTRMTSVLQ